MDQSKSDNKIQVPKKKFSLEFLVGLFTLFGLLCSAWLAIGLGGIKLFNSKSYTITAEFDNISGLKNGASVEIAGVPIGEVTSILLKDPQAVITMRIDNGVQIKDDDVALIRTKGIIGDRYVKISRGSSGSFIQPGQNMMETESVVDFEDIIGKIVHSMTNKETPEE